MFMRLRQTTGGAHARAIPRHGPLSQAHRGVGRSSHPLITLDRENRLYVPDTNRHRVQIYQKTFLISNAYGCRKKSIPVGDARPRESPLRP